MLLIALTTALALQVPAAPAADTAAPYDSPATQELVRRTIAASGQVPPELHDYRAEVQTSMFVTLGADTVAGGPGGDLPAAVDEIVSEVHWNRQGQLLQEVVGHRVRLLIPLPYTLGTLFESPWVIPHLYGSAAERDAAFTPFVGTPAAYPFSPSGPRYYRYSSGDTVRVQVQGEQVTLVPVTVRPRVRREDTNLSLVLGTFYIDVGRAAVARARFGFSGGGGGLPATLGRLETFWELENALWEGRYWLPAQQRRDIVFYSRALGGAVAARAVSRFVGFDLNTGWEPQPGKRVRLVWNLQKGDAPFAGWREAVGAEAGEYSIQDFSDLRLATALDPTRTAPLRTQLHYQRGSHLFRYNRVEGPFLGVGGRVIPADPRRRRWEVYATGGWAFAEETARGEVSARWGAAVASAPTAALDWGVEGAAYRRLEELQPFRRTYTWDWLYSLPALLWGSDPRDYYDAAGVELTALARRGRWTARLGGRVEEEDSVQVNTSRFLFGTSDEFGPLAGVEPGTHAALEGSVGYTLGPGAFGIGNSAVLQAGGEAGVGDFRFNRLTGLLSVRYELGPLTFAGRADAGHAWGGAPPQKLFRFGQTEGLRGYEPNEFGGSTAALGRARLLVGIPPRSNQPLGRFDVFIIPPLRPSLVLLAESGWTRVDDDLADELARLRARPTGGARSSLGVGLSIFQDALTLEYLHPVGPDAAGRKGRWYAGLVTWY